jgi:hypothetical protein
VTCSCDIFILLLLYKEGKNNSTCMNVKRESQSSYRVILISIRTEVSRYFKVIIVLGFGTCLLGFL